MFFPTENQNNSKTNTFYHIFLIKTPLIRLNAHLVISLTGTKLAPIQKIPTDSA